MHFWHKSILKNYIYKKLALNAISYSQADPRYRLCKKRPPLVVHKRPHHDSGMGEEKHFQVLRWPAVSMEWRCQWPFACNPHVTSLVAEKLLPITSHFTFLPKPASSSLSSQNSFLQPRVELQYCLPPGNCIEVPISIKERGIFTWWQEKD